LLTPIFFETSGTVIPLPHSTSASRNFATICGPLCFFIRELLSNLLVGQNSHCTWYSFWGEGPLRGGDLSATLTGHNAAGRNLGVAVVIITDEEAAQGWHNIQDPVSFFLLTDFDTTEPLDIPEFRFEVTPEPATMGFLAVGGLVAPWRRRQ
jgi:hypothetical protein